MTDRTVSLSESEVGYSETLATWTTRYVDPSGFECLLSIQAETGSQVIKKAEGAIAYLTELKCLPLHPGNCNGNGQEKASKSDAIVEVKQDGNSGKTICPIHKIEMTRWSKNGRTWFAHRWQDGWCNGKPK